KETAAIAPESWKTWGKGGPKALEKSRRRVSRLFTMSSVEQKPAEGSIESNALNAIYNFYSGRKARFEALASKITAYIIRESGAHYISGWITPSTSDGGADFFGRINIGTGFGHTKLILLGQAKCEKLNSPTGGNHIARTVARLKRGWVGAYVTTSYFSEAVQREIIEDSYPILLINGLKIASVSLRIVHDEGHPSLSAFLNTIDAEYSSLVKARRP
ncbi:MAG: restriction endonuclease, partial [Bacteroides sp.]|nr:restriction endonuclease [Bacteroides sp.]